ncbi:MAG: cellulase family glycosylhydrolase [Spirochaetaceae bacterium]|nr:cellulase family glycosylhydrolase [Spirochaetaceae bacterium]
MYMVILFFVLASCNTTPHRSRYISPVRENMNFNGLQFGVCHAGYSRSDEEYALLDELGIEWIRIDFHWNKMEKSQGEWDFSLYDDFLDKAVGEGKKVLAILVYDTQWLHRGKDKRRRISPEEMPLFLNYVRTVAERYGSRVGAFEIWNEPNSNRFWAGSDKDFLELTRQTLHLLKKVCPQTPVAVGSLFYNPIIFAGSYLQKLIHSGVLDEADALSIHPYTLSPHILEKRILNVRKRMATAGYFTPLWITEVGFPTGGTYPNRIPLEKQGRTVAQTLTRLGAGGVELITWYNFSDELNEGEVEPGMSSEDFFGIIRPDYSLKPGAYPFSVLAKELKGTLFIPDSFPFKGTGLSSLYEAQFLSNDGVRKIVLWSTGNEVTLDLSPGDKNITIIDLMTGGQLEPDREGILSVTKDPVLMIIP